jgi:hypothetical protein
VATLLDFFDAASSTLRTATMHCGPNYLWGGIISGSLPLTRRIVFLCLESFISWCQLGDAVISATKEAPVLRTLQVHGPPIDSEIIDDSTWVII